MPKETPVTIRFWDDVHERLKKYAEKTHQSVNRAVNDIVKEKLDKPKGE